MQKFKLLVVFISLALGLGMLSASPVEAATPYANVHFQLHHNISTGQITTYISRYSNGNWIACRPTLCGHFVYNSNATVTIAHYSDEKLVPSVSWERYWSSHAVSTIGYSGKAALEYYYSTYYHEERYLEDMDVFYHFS